MKTFVILAALLTLGTVNTDLYAQKKKPTKAELAAEQARKDSINAIRQKAEKGDAWAMNEVGSWYYTGANDCAKDYKTAVQWYAKSAKAGSTSAIGNLALAYQKGHGVEADSVKSVELYQKAIEKGAENVLKRHEKLASDNNLYSLLLLADIYENGKAGKAKSLAKAADYYASAANQGLVKAMRQGGLCYLNSKQAAKAFPLFKAGAEKGDLTSIFYTGLQLHDGNGVAKDVDQAANYMLKAAEAGMTNANYHLGNYYRNGEGVRKDLTAAAEWYKKALVNSNPAAAWELAELYRKGEGVETDFDQAIGLYAAALSNNYNVREFRKMVDEDLDFRKTPFATYLKGLRQYSVDKNYAEALKSFKAVSKAGRLEGDVMQGVLMATKAYEKCNEKKAFKTLSKLIDKSPFATYYVGQFYEQGISVEKDLAKALDFYGKSAARGCALAMNCLGDMRFEGRGVQKDVKAAVENYLAAYAIGQLSEAGAKRLANCYESGQGGLNKDTKKAEEILRRVKNDAFGNLLKQVASL